MAKAEEKKAVVIATNEKVVVYKSRERKTWINSFDMSTEYEPKELRF